MSYLGGGFQAPFARISKKDVFWTSFTLKIIDFSLDSCTAYFAILMYHSKKSWFNDFFVILYRIPTFWVWLKTLTLIWWTNLTNIKITNVIILFGHFEFNAAKIIRWFALRWLQYWYMKASYNFLYLLYVAGNNLILNLQISLNMNKKLL